MHLRCVVCRSPFKDCPLFYIVAHTHTRTHPGFQRSGFSCHSHVELFIPLSSLFKNLTNQAPWPLLPHWVLVKFIFCFKSGVVILYLYNKTYKDNSFWNLDPFQVFLLFATTLTCQRILLKNRCFAKIHSEACCSLRIFLEAATQTSLTTCV